MQTLPHNATSFQPLSFQLSTRFFIFFRTFCMMVYAVQGTLKRQSLFPKWGAEPQSQRTPNRGSDLGHRNSIVAVELCSLLNNKNTLRVCSAYNKQPNQYTRGKSLKSTIDFHQLCSLPPPKKKKTSPVSYDRKFCPKTKKCTPLKTNMYPKKGLL